MTNIEKRIEEKLEAKIKLLIDKGTKMLLKGELYDLENWMKQELNEVHELILEEILTKIGTSRAFMKKLGKIRSALGLGKLKRRKVSLQISTGKRIEFVSYYAEKGRNFLYQGERHLSLLYWHCLKKASPVYYSTAGLLSILCPSFEVAVQLLGHFGIKGDYKRIRSLSFLLGNKGRQLGASALLQEGESLEGERVVVSADGGRTRTRVYKSTKGKKGKKVAKKFDTPWKEPKVFVIHVLDKHGKLKKKTRLPFYGATMDNIDGFLVQLSQALAALQIQKAKAIQFIADGATCFWNNIRQVFLDLGVKPSKITYTLDYYHALEHLHDLVKLLPGKEEEKQDYLKQFKEFLWDGAIYSIQKRVKNALSKAKQIMSDELTTALDYFIKHTDHMQYFKYKRKKWLCGSGLMESAIRRIINLRFKGASSFWLIENLDPLFFLRTTFLSGRWHFFMQSLIKN